MVVLWKQQLYIYEGSSAILKGGLLFEGGITLFFMCSYINFFNLCIHWVQ
jgi:hypothetical protein